MQFSFNNINELLKFSEVSLNKEIAEALKELGRLQTDPWKGTAYNKAAHNIENLDIPVDSIPNLKDIEGIGEDIAKEIYEFINTGKINKLEFFRKKEEEKGKFNLEDAINLSKEFFSLADFLGLKYTITGSIRRKLPKVKDVDAIILLEEFEDWKSLVEETASKILREGKEEIDFIFNNIGINLRAVEENELGAGILYFTGPKGFSIMMRKKSKELGYILNRHGLFNRETGERIAKTEEDIFYALNMKYIKPEER